jgi:hypothetical protein
MPLSIFPSPSHATTNRAYVSTASCFSDAPSAAGLP